MFPIQDFAGTAHLDFDHYVLEDPKFDTDECRQRGITFRAARTEEEHVSQTMLDQLHTSSNREAALLHFIGNLADEDAELLRRSLRKG